MTEPPIDLRRLEQLRRYANEGVSPVDPIAVATTAMAAPRRWTSAWHRPWLAWVPAVVVPAALLVGLLAAAFAFGGNRPVGPSTIGFTALEAPAMGFGPTVARLLDGRVLIVGSLPADPTNGSPGQPAAWLWDPESRAFTRTGDPGATRELAVAALLPDGRVLVAGGGYETPLASAEIYDPATGTFAPTGATGSPRGWAHGRSHVVRPLAVTLDDGRTLVMGGTGEGAGATMDIFEPDRDGFRQVPGASGCEDGQMVAVRLEDGRVLIRCDLGAWLYDPSDDSMRGVEDPAATGRDGSEGVDLGAAHLLPDGRVLFTGALSRTQSGILAHGPADVFDPTTEAFQNLATRDNPSARSLSITLQDGRILFTGGGSTLLFDPGTETFADTEAPGVEYPTSATLLDDGHVFLLWGGAQGESRASVFDPSAPFQPGPSPTASPWQPPRGW